ncbi:alpha/beta fold hydrolase [Quisquiliibacterium transsilvanicum]|uniref:Pimeloyl-ACP methyl ester carboxylesterase n=1 Tax=Quisquiliibacterium transsilvanicum TaxID=1549638 RepID=A0A7W8HKE3_9BURK|nr:alpha/beta hydrolase [Quisquiliibacterium transsilvanicum]MBB5273709.1 pimeloyl-ACP methyl ester carboxylesterase [Quisquiliibacterium transsilvanicum]
MPSYLPRRHSRSEFHPVRGLRYHVRIWDPVPDRPAEGTLVLLHGWMDVSASYQFLVDAFERNWRIISPDWRGFGLTDRPGADSYWFPDYLADLDILLDTLLPDQPVDLVAHSMGGNIATLYSGVRPHRVRRLVNLEGLGMQSTRPEQAPARYARWIDEVRHGARLRDYGSRAEVAERLAQNNPRLSPAKAGFLAEHWSLPGPDGRFVLAGDPAHKIVNAQLYRVEEVLACWREVRADVMLVVANHSERWHAFLNTEEFRLRKLALRSLRTEIVDDAGHMLHHDQPEAVARLIEEFIA